MQQKKTAQSARMKTFDLLGVPGTPPPGLVRTPGRWNLGPPSTLFHLAGWTPSGILKKTPCGRYLDQNSKVYCVCTFHHNPLTWPGVTFSTSNWPAQEQVLRNGCQPSSPFRVLYTINHGCMHLILGQLFKILICPQKHYVGNMYTI